MRKIIAITILAVFFCLIEIVLFNIFDRWFKPNLLIILIVFVNLHSGIRYSIITAIIAGILKDCFSLNLFGLNMFSFIFCAYLTTFIRRSFYQVGSSASKIRTVAAVATVNVLIHYIFVVIFASAQFGSMLMTVLIPEVFWTSVVSGFIFKRLKALLQMIEL
jgi:rod shape-determining protein MreD